MGKSALRDEWHVAWENADHPDGPWKHLRVVSVQGEESLSRPFAFEFEVYHDMRGRDVDVEDLVGARMTLKLRTRTEPANRVVHGVIAGATQLEVATSADVARYRLVMRPPSVRAAMMRKSSIYLNKTLRQIIEQVLRRTSLGAALQASTAARPFTVGDSLSSYAPPTLSFAWAVEADGRLDDPAARPYCVQYDESDFDFVSRLLEEEGISYHYEHGDDECVFVMTDYDGGRLDRSAEAPFGPNLRGREVFDWRAGGRLRPRSVHLDDYNWQHPTLDLRAQSPSGVTDFTDIVHPGRYQASESHGRALARAREERFDSERVYAAAEGHARPLTAGTVFRLDHNIDKFRGTYLVTAVRHQASQREVAATDGELQEPYRQELELLRCGKGDFVAPSRYRPECVTRKPRIFGTQTAIVTADPSDPNAEINVGGPSDLGCVRVRFHWDMDATRCENEPSSCWVRVSQFFAGRDHGALWHPRVGDEVIVEFLDGDPDRPIVTGRVYNGVSPAPENATRRPTFSAIKSNTSPHNGNYNLIAFEDLQGSEEIIIHAARDLNLNVHRNCTQVVADFSDLHVRGNQRTNVDGWQTISTKGFLSIDSATSITNSAPFINLNANNSVSVQGGSKVDVRAPVVRAHADAVLHAKADGILFAQAPTVVVTAGVCQVQAATVRIEGTAVVSVSGGEVNVQGGIVKINS